MSWLGASVVVAAVAVAITVVAIVAVVVGLHVGKTCFTNGFARLQLSKGLL